MDFSSEDLVLIASFCLRVSMARFDCRTVDHWIRKFNGCSACPASPLAVANPNLPALAKKGACSRAGPGYSVLRNS